MIAGTRGLRRPGARAGWLSLRTPFLVTGLVALALFGVDTLAAVAQPYEGWDVPVARAVQSVQWAGPFVWAFQAVDWMEGMRQLALAGAGLLLVLLVRRRAFPLAVVCALSGGAYTLTELLVRRPRPPAGLIHVVRHTNGFSYPSGHEVFFTWFVAVLILALLRPRLPRPIVLAAWALWPLVLLMVAVGRVDLGEHWPSDVLGGLALGVAWISLALSVRRLSDPVLEAGGGAARS
jgi:membrane-associated phospholipid phosphatase